MHVSGIGEWFVNPFAQEAKDLETFCVVLLDGKVGYEEALRSSKFHASCVGLVSMSRGFGLCVRPPDYDAL